MAGLVAAAVVDVARINGALLSAGGEDLEVSRGILQSLHQLDLIGSGVLLRPINPAELQIRPIDMLSEDSDSEGINGGAN